MTISNIVPRFSTIKISEFMAKPQAMQPSIRRIIVSYRHPNNIHFQGRSAVVRFVATPLVANNNNGKGE